MATLSGALPPRRQNTLENILLGKVRDDRAALEALTAWSLERTPGSDEKIALHASAAQHLLGLASRSCQAREWADAFVPSDVICKLVVVDPDLSVKLGKDGMRELCDTLLSMLLVLNTVQSDPDLSEGLEMTLALATLLTAAQGLVLQDANKEMSDEFLARVGPSLATATTVAGPLPNESTHEMRSLVAFSLLQVKRCAADLLANLLEHASSEQKVKCELALLTSETGGLRRADAFGLGRTSTIESLRRLDELCGEGTCKALRALTPESLLDRGMETAVRLNKRCSLEITTLPSCSFTWGHLTVSQAVATLTSHSLSFHALSGQDPCLPEIELPWSCVELESESASQRCAVQLRVDLQCACVLNAVPLSVAEQVALEDTVLDVLCETTCLQRFRGSLKECVAFFRDLALQNIAALPVNCSLPLIQPEALHLVSASTVSPDVLTSGVFDGVDKCKDVEAIDSHPISPPSPVQPAANPGSRVRSAWLGGGFPQQPDLHSARPPEFAVSGAGSALLEKALRASCRALGLSTRGEGMELAQQILGAAPPSPVTRGGTKPRPVNASGIANAPSALQNPTVSCEASPARLRNQSHDFLHGSPPGSGKGERHSKPPFFWSPQQDLSRVTASSSSHRTARSLRRLRSKSPDPDRFSSRADHTLGANSSTGSGSAKVVKDHIEECQKGSVLPPDVLSNLLKVSPRPTTLSAARPSPQTVAPVEQREQNALQPPSACRLVNAGGSANAPNAPQNPTASREASPARLRNPSHDFLCGSPRGAENRGRHSTPSIICSSRQHLPRVLATPSESSRETARTLRRLRSKSPDPERLASGADRSLGANRLTVTDSAKVVTDHIEQRQKGSALPSDVCSNLSMLSPRPTKLSSARPLQQRVAPLEQREQHALELPSACRLVSAGARASDATAPCNPTDSHEASPACLRNHSHESLRGSPAAEHRGRPCSPQACVSSRDCARSLRCVRSETPDPDRPSSCADLSCLPGQLYLDTVSGKSSAGSGSAKAAKDHVEQCVKGSTLPSDVLLNLSVLSPRATILSAARPLPHRVVPDEETSVPLEQKALELPSACRSDPPRRNSFATQGANIASPSPSSPTELLLDSSPVQDIEAGQHGRDACHGATDAERCSLLKRPFRKDPDLRRPARVSDKALLSVVVGPPGDQTWRLARAPSNQQRTKKQRTSKGKGAEESRGRGAYKHGQSCR